jgi:hypothetical protein
VIRDRILMRTLTGRRESVTDDVLVVRLMEWQDADTEMSNDLYYHLLFTGY